MSKRLSLGLFVLFINMSLVVMNNSRFLNFWMAFYKLVQILENRRKQEVRERGKEMRVEKESYYS